MSKLHTSSILGNTDANIHAHHTVNSQYWHDQQTCSSAMICEHHFLRVLELSLGVYRDDTHNFMINDHFTFVIYQLILPGLVNQGCSRGSHPTARFKCTTIRLLSRWKIWLAMLFSLTWVHLTDIQNHLQILFFHEGNQPYPTITM